MKVNKKGKSIKNNRVTNSIKCRIILLICSRGALHKGYLVPSPPKLATALD